MRNGELVKFKKFLLDLPIGKVRDLESKGKEVVGFQNFNCHTLFVGYHKKYKLRKNSDYTTE